MNKKIISLFIFLVLGLFIAGCSGPVGKKVYTAAPEEPNPPQQPGIDPTYQNVLNMLNSCEVFVASGNSINCNQRCEGVEQTCIFWFLRESNTSQSGIHPCAIGISGSSLIADCICCDTIFSTST